MQSNSKKRFNVLLSGIFLMMICFCSNFSKAQGNLLITPKRIVFEGSKKSEEINLANIGKDSATYIISFIQIRMNENGSFEKITEPDSAQLFADKNIRFFPRSVTLAPNESQTVKVQIIKMNELQPGEYRSHLYLRANPAPKPLGEEVVDSKDSTLSVRLVPIFGISIPVILRRGESNAAAKIAAVYVDYEKDDNNIVNIVFNRSGNMSLYGNVAVDYISPQGKTSRVGIVKGMAIYSPNPVRHFKMKLDQKADINYHEGKLRVVYTDLAGKGATLAQAETDLH